MWEESLPLKTEAKENVECLSLFCIRPVILSYLLGVYIFFSFSDKTPAEGLIIILTIVVKFLLWLDSLSPGLRPLCIPGVSLHLVVLLPSRCQSG